MQRNEEHREQSALIRYVMMQYPDVRFCASAGGLHTSQAQAGKMKQAGYSKGFPDLQFTEPRGGHFGLFIEMKKSKGGRATPEQRQWIADLNERGYRAEFANGFEAAKEIVDHYFSLSVTPKSNQ